MYFLLLLSHFSCVRLCRRWQPTRLPRPWDSPGKNTGVGCHFLLQCMKVKSQSEVAQSCPTLRDLMDCSLPGSSVHGIFQARVLEWGAIAFSDVLSRSTQFIILTQCFLYACTYSVPLAWHTLCLSIIFLLHQGLISMQSLVRLYLVPPFALALLFFEPRHEPFPLCFHLTSTSSVNFVYVFIFHINTYFHIYNTKT